MFETLGFILQTCGYALFMLAMKRMTLSVFKWISGKSNFYQIEDKSLVPLTIIAIAVLMFGFGTYYKFDVYDTSHRGDTASYIALGLGTFLVFTNKEINQFWTSSKIITDRSTATSYREARSSNRRYSQPDVSPKTYNNDSYEPYPYEDETIEKEVLRAMEEEQRCADDCTDSDYEN